MKIDVFLSAINIEELFFNGRTVVVIDVLRATSTIITALNNGAKEIIPVDSVEFAIKVSGSAFGGKTILAGERDTKKVDGFTLGNSPLEFSPEAVEGKSIIFFTTNGSKAIVKSKFAKNLFLMSFANLDAVANRLIKLKQDVNILCAGTNGRLSLEDTVCAGKLISSINDLYSEIELTDAAKASVVLNKSFGKNIKKMLTESEHGKLLIQNGFTDDLIYCSQVNITSAIPYFHSGTITLLDNTSKRANEPQGK